MKLKKKTIMGLSAILGALMFTTTAFAEVTSKSGYDQIKDALKNSAEVYSERLSSFTMDRSITVKDNGKIVDDIERTNRYDFTNHKEENTQTEASYGQPKIQSYYYADPSIIIDYNSQKKVYNETDYSKPNNFKMGNNPLKTNNEEDLEKICDAVIGNLKDSIVVDEKKDGTKELSGAVKQGEIPAIVNALASYEIKAKYGNNDGSGIFPKNMKDIYVKNASVDLNLNKDGIIQKGSISAEVSCKDGDGTSHDLIFEMMGKAYNINSTKTEKINLDGKNVQKNQMNYTDPSFKPEMYIGSYKHDIAIQKNGQFIKIGEATVDITSANSKTMKGSYHEIYLKGYESYVTALSKLNFTATMQDSYNGNVSGIDANGNKQQGTISIMGKSPSIAFYLNNSSNEIVDTTYNRIFN